MTAVLSQEDVQRVDRALRRAGGELLLQNERAAQREDAQPHRRVVVELVGDGRRRLVRVERIGIVGHGAATGVGIDQGRLDLGLSLMESGGMVC